MRDVILTAIGFSILGFILTSHALYRSIDVYKTMLTGEEIQVIPKMLVNEFSYKRARASSPTYYVYSTISKETGNVISLNELSLGVSVNCTNSEKLCFHTSENSLFNFIDSIYFIKLIMGLLFILTGALTYLLRKKILDRIAYVKQQES